MSINTSTLFAVAFTAIITINLSSCKDSPKTCPVVTPEQLGYSDHLAWDDPLPEPEPIRPPAAFDENGHYIPENCQREYVKWEEPEHEISDDPAELTRLRTETMSYLTEIDPAKLLDPQKVNEYNPYWCNGAEYEVAQLIAICKKQGDQDCVKLWSRQLAHVYEHKLDFCEDVYTERFDDAYQLYQDAGRTKDAQRIADTQYKMLRSQFIWGGHYVSQEDINGRYLGECPSPRPRQEWLIPQIRTWYTNASHTEEQVETMIVDLRAEAKAKPVEPFGEHCCW